MDESETAIVATSHIAGAMNYPSTTQALFALIVMIIVLLFILVYCCWGTFSCANQENPSAPSAEEGGAGSNTQPAGVRQILHGTHTVIVPINNMIYVGDPETHQIYQIPMGRDKPPAYTEVFCAGPPPPYRPDPAASDSSSNTTTNREQQDNRTALPESPPAYEECLSATSEEFRGEQSPDPPQQEDTAATEPHVDTTASAVTGSSPSPGPKPEEVQGASPQRTGLILTVGTLPQVSSQPAEEGPSNTHTEPQRGH